MKQLILRKPHDLRVEHVPEPEPVDGEVLVRVSSVGICGSDLHAYTGEHPFVIYPVVPGHEMSGTIESVGGSVSSDLVGAAVCVEPSFVCGACLQCLSGRYNICSNLKVMGFQAPGCMCEAVCVPVDQVFLLPPNVETRTGALVEPLAVAVHAFERSGARSGDTVLVTGAGVIGTMVMRVARAEGCHVVCVEPDAGRRRRASKAGVELVFDGSATADGIVASIGSAPVAVFECSGAPGAIDLAVRSARRGSVVVIVGVVSEPAPVPLELVQDREIELRGTLMYMAEDFDRAIGMLASEDIFTGDVITNVVSLDEAEAGYMLLLDGEADVMKVVVEPGG